MFSRPLLDPSPGIQGLPIRLRQGVRCRMLPHVPMLALLALLALFALTGSALANPADSAAVSPTNTSGLNTGDAGGAPIAKEQGLLKEDSQDCMRCHWMETMAYRDRETGKIVNLSINRDAYSHSVHSELACRDCHDKGFSHYPHRSSSADEALNCVDCHEDRQDDGAPNLIGLKHEYDKSVHVTEGVEAFSCFSCHNPHRFHPAQAGESIVDVVAETNNTCLDCHTELLTPVPKGHEWLPRPQAHWGSVRCLDCHTPLEGRIPDRPSHNVLAADDSNRLCVECHSKGSELLSQLYNYRAEQAREQDGFFSQAIYNDAYIVGMTRNPWMDRIGLAMILLMILGVAAHGLGRYLTRRRQEGSK